MALPNGYDWNRIRAALRQLHEAFPGLLENVALIGGGACECYREVEDAMLVKPARRVARARSAKTTTLDFFFSDSRLVARLHAGIARLPAAGSKAIHYWAKHHLPGFAT